MKRELNISRPAGIITTEMAIYAEERSQGGGERFGLVHGGQAGRQADGQARGAPLPSIHPMSALPRSSCKKTPDAAHRTCQPSVRCLTRKLVSWPRVTPAGQNRQSSAGEQLVQWQSLCGPASGACHHCWRATATARLQR